MSRVSTDLTIAGSAIVVLAALVAVVRAVFWLAVTFRDNTRATKDLTTKMDALAVSIDGRFDQLVDRVTRLVERVTKLEGKP